MARQHWTLCLGLTILLRSCTGARILCLSHQYGSHLLMVQAIGEELIARGHEVYTVLSDQLTEPQGLRAKGFHILKFHSPENHPIMASPQTNEKIINDIIQGKNIVPSVFSLVPLNECKDMDADTSLETTLKSLQFDLIIINVFPISYCLTFMPLKLDLPFILIRAAMDMESMRTPALPSFTPFTFLEFSDNMGFSERLLNTLITVGSNIVSISPFVSHTDVSLLDKYNTDPEVRTWKMLTRKAQLQFVTRGQILEYPLPLTPNVINIECLTCKPGKSLPADLEAVIGNYKTTVVVSFGSQIEKLPEEVAMRFLAAFRRMENVLFFWRFSGKLSLDDVPPNIKMMKWLPQNDLLAHLKTKLFITHAGNNGQHESVYHGVPMLAFPMFGDQHHNARRVEVHGFGLRESILKFTETDLVDKIKELLHNSTFTEKTQKAGRILKGSTMSAKQKAVYWVEHVLEFGGDHLRSHGLNMPWYSFYMIDVMLVIQILLITVTCLFIWICKHIFGFLRGPKAKSKLH